MKKTYENEKKIKINENINVINNNNLIQEKKELKNKEKEEIYKKNENLINEIKNKKQNKDYDRNINEVNKYLNKEKDEIIEKENKNNYNQELIGTQKDNNFKKIIKISDIKNRNLESIFLIKSK